MGTKLNEAELHGLEVRAAKRKQTQACRLLLVNLLGPVAKGQAMTSEVFDGIVDLVKSRRRVWLWTGSKTTKRGAEPRWQSTLRYGSRRTEESAARERVDGYGNG